MNIIKEAKRKDIHVATLNKIREFLEKQVNPIYKTDIQKILGVDYDSLNIALTMIKIETDPEGRIFIRRRK